ncbi:sulfotransferase domain-containing protein [Posidoniimonas corsicana]|uniref:sulfotransferase domain-containing protein n=1 Tax=Posidoniimonas corsicana TaxID=1938618 RepID=UPI0018D3DD92|nr:sulfotransferase domain-containing protein [Posidoniimonas corsicana]
MSYISGWMRRFGTRSTRFVGEFWGESFPFYYVTEFPKSGGTWLAKMVADYLQIPKPTHTVFPMGCSCVIQNHWKYSPRLRRVFYLYRDGRDVCTSAYFHVLRGLEAGDEGTKAYVQRLFPEAVADRWSVESSAENMATFVTRWCTRPLGISTPWADHVQQWTSSREHVALVRYEDLLSDCAGTLGRAIESHSGTPADPVRVRDTVEKFSFERQTGRKPGESDASSHNRKGIAGDWKNHFTPAAVAAFKEHAGDQLVALGYERDHTWTARI